MTQASGSTTSVAGFTYDQALTPWVAVITPVRGSTLITVSGTVFATSGNNVMIDGSICDIASETETNLTCYTNSHNIV